MMIKGKVACWAGTTPDRLIFIADTYDEALDYHKELKANKDEDLTQIVIFREWTGPVPKGGTKVPQQLSLFDKEKDSIRNGKCSYCPKSLIGHIGNKTHGVNYCFNHKDNAESDSSLWSN